MVSIKDEIEALAESQRAEQEALNAKAMSIGKKSNNIQIGDIWLYRGSLLRVLSISEPVVTSSWNLTAIILEVIFSYNETSERTYRRSYRWETLTNQALLVWREGGEL